MSIDVYVTPKIYKQSLVHSWMTSIQENIHGGEKRSSLVTWPRIKLNSDLTLISTAERRFIRASLYQSIHKIWGFPFVHDKTLLTSQAANGQMVLTVAETSYRHFYNGRGCILINPSNWELYEYGTINTVDSATQITLADNLISSWPIGTYVYPMYEYRIEEVQEVNVSIKQLNYITLAATESMEDLRSFSYSIPSSGAPTYNGLDLFLIAFQYPTTESYRHPFEHLVFFGKDFISSVYDKTRFAFDLDFIIISRSDIWDLLKFFDSKRGRFQTFYMPSRNNDIVPTAAIAADAVTLTVETLYLSSVEIVGRHLWIRLPNQSYVCREVTAVPTSTTITISSSIGTTISQANLSKMLICFLNKVRFNVDEILLEYTADSIAKTKLRFRVVW